MATEYCFYGTCATIPTEDVEELTSMTDNAVDVSYETMRNHCEGLIDWALSVGYERNRTQGLTLKQDWAVSYHRSTFYGERCYYLRWSAYEVIWRKK